MVWKHAQFSTVSHKISIDFFFLFVGLKYNLISSYLEKFLLTWETEVRFSHLTLLEEQWRSHPSFQALAVIHQDWKTHSALLLPYYNELSRHGQQDSTICIEGNWKQEQIFPDCISVSLRVITKNPIQQVRAQIHAQLILRFYNELNSLQPWKLWLQLTEM